MDQAKMALDVRWATVREDFTKTRFQNIKKAQAKLIRSGGELDKQLLHDALGNVSRVSGCGAFRGQLSLVSAFVHPIHDTQRYLNI
jgi:hypothetical protein